MISTMLMLACTSCMAFNAQQKKIVEMIGKVNDYWQSHHKPETRAFWDNAAYHTLSRSFRRGGEGPVPHTSQHAVRRFVGFFSGLPGTPHVPPLFFLPCCWSCLFSRDVSFLYLLRAFLLTDID